MIGEFIGNWAVSYLQLCLLEKSTDYIVRFCALKRVNTKGLKEKSLSRYRLNMVDALLKTITKEDIQKYLKLS